MRWLAAGPSSGSFYPRAPGGARQEHFRKFEAAWWFLSARPGRGATGVGGYIAGRSVEFLSARPGRGATDDRIAELVDEYVSIRAPRAGRDPQYVTFLAGHIIVSIRAPRAGRDEKESDGDLEVETCFYPRAPGGARHCQSIPICLIKTFLSARPGRGATGTEGQDDVWYVVSIRAARAGRDAGGAHRVRPRAGFYPRGPCGPRLSKPSRFLSKLVFLSARPVRAATTMMWLFSTPPTRFLSARPVRAATIASR